jgi:hypothetical protein
MREAAKAGAAVTSCKPSDRRKSTSEPASRLPIDHPCLCTPAPRELNRLNPKTARELGVETVIGMAASRFTKPFELTLAGAASVQDLSIEPSHRVSAVGRSRPCFEHL